MTDRILALIAFLSLAGFVAILVTYVNHIDLTIVVVAVVVMAAIDFILLNRTKKG